jgi:hypothetical protein
MVGAARRGKSHSPEIEIGEWQSCAPPFCPNFHSVSLGQRSRAGASCTDVTTASKLTTISVQSVNSDRIWRIFRKNMVAKDNLYPVHVILVSSGDDTCGYPGARCAGCLGSYPREFRLWELSVP